MNRESQIWCSIVFLCLLLCAAYVLTLTNAFTFIFAFQDVQRRASLRKAIIDLWQGLLLLVLIVAGTHWTYRQEQESILEWIKSWTLSSHKIGVNTETNTLLNGMTQCHDCFDSRKLNRDRTLNVDKSVHSAYITVCTHFQLCKNKNRYRFIRLKNLNVWIWYLCKSAKDLVNSCKLSSLLLHLLVKRSI